jgi:hypothetical protein
VSRVASCNGVNECGDYSDEENCASNKKIFFVLVENYHFSFVAQPTYAPSVSNPTSHCNYKYFFFLKHF